MQQAFADNWLGDVAAFRCSPRGFLTSRRITPDSLVLDILQILCSEGAEVVKISLLALLQEHVDVLFADALSVEHTFASLKDMFEQSAGSPEVNYRAQVLTTLTTLAVSFDFLTTQAQLLSGYINTLLSNLSEVNVHDQAAVRTCACHSLRELELAYPGLLAVKMGHFFAMASQEQSYIAQDYMLLAVTVMKHVLHMVIADSRWHTEQSLQNWLTSRAEPLLPYTLPETLPDLDASSEARLSLGSLLPSFVDTKELRRAVSVIKEFVPLMTPAGRLLAMRELIDCVRWTGLSPTTFKHELLRNLATSSLSFLHLAILLKMKFPADFLEIEEDELLLHRLLIYGDHPDLSNEHRLMAYQFLRHFPKQGLGQTIVPSDDCFVAGLEDSIQKRLYPTVFDNDSIMQVKLDTLSLQHLAEADMDQSEDESSALQRFSSRVDLMALLQCLHKPLQFGVRGFVAAAFYRTVFAFYRRHSSTPIADDIYKLLVGTVTRHPCYTAHTIDFLECVRKTHPDSALPLNMLQALGEQTVSTPIDDLVRHLPFHLTLLQHVAHESRIDPSPILSYLLQVLHCSSLCQQGNWSIGNKILSICSCTLQHHSSSSVYTDIGNLLVLLSSRYNDVDIRDRARLYYSLVSSVSSNKLMDLLTQGSDGTSASQRLTRLVEVGLIAPSFPPATPVQPVAEAVLKLTRIPKDVVHNLPTHDYRQDPLPTVNASELLDWYLEQVQAVKYQLRVTLPCFLHFNETCPFKQDLQHIYAICVHLATAANYAPTEDGLVSFLSRMSPTAPVSSPPACSPVTLELSPLSPSAAVFSVSASYSGNGGETFSTELAELPVAFQDLFQPLLLPEDSKEWESERVACARQVLFERLWFALAEGHNGLKHIQTVVCVPNHDHNAERILREELSHFIVLDSDSLLLVAIALPPRHMLLLRVTSSESQSVVRVMTDVWEVLPAVETYIHGLVNQPTQQVG